MFFKVIWWVIDAIPRLFNKVIITQFKKSLMRSTGRNVSVGRRVRASGWGNISIGNDSSIGADSMLICTRANIIDHVMLAPRVTIITGTGGHRTDMVGRLMSTIKDNEKGEELDKNIVIEGDNWIGSNVTILKGVTIDRGSVIAAGSVVSKNVPEYAIYGGIPAKLIRMRFDESVLHEHKTILNQKYRIPHSSNKA